MAFHESLCEVFGAFQLRTRLGGANDGNILRPGIVVEVIGYAADERDLRTYYQHVYVVLVGKVLKALEVVDINRYVFSNIVCAGVSRGDVKF